MTNLTRRAALGALGTTLAMPAIRARAAQPTYALVTINQQALFFNQMNSGAMAAAKKAGAKLVIFNANNEPAAQNNAIDDYIQQKVDGLIVDAIDVNGLMPAVKAAAAAGIPVIAVDAILPADGPQKAQIGVDNTAGGASRGEIPRRIRASLPGRQGELGVVGALNSLHSEPAAEGFEDALAKEPGIKLVQVVDGRNVQDNAMSAAETLITGNPDMNTLYATGEPALIGASGGGGKPGQRADRVKVLGWDLSAAAIKAIDEGYASPSCSRIRSRMGGGLRRRAGDAEQGRHGANEINVPADARHQGERRAVSRRVQMSCRHDDRRPGCRRRCCRCAASARPMAPTWRCAASISTCSPASAWAWSATTRRASRR